MKTKLLALLALSLFAASSAFGYTQDFRCRTQPPPSTPCPQGDFLRWPANTEITFVFNNQFAPNNPSQLVSAALLSAGGTWISAFSANGIPLTLKDGGTTALNTAQCDQVNLVTFTATDPPLSPSTLAIARTFSAVGPGPVGNCPPAQAQFAGQIIDADIVFNPSIRFSTVGLADTSDIEPVTLHELGHTLGLHHSGINSAIMAPAGDSLGTQRRLQADDIAGINFVYGTNGPGRAIQGIVTEGGGGAVGAQVVATNAATGVTTAAALSGADGRYRIVGLPPGAYKVFVEPLDGPIFLGDVSSVFSNGNDTFATVFRGAAVDVTNADAAGIDFQVSQRTMNAQTLAVLVGGSGLGGPPPLTVKRGNTAEIRVGGTGLSGDLTFSSPKVVPSGATTTSGSELRRTVQIAADAVPGGTDVNVTSSSLTGGLQITVNPVIPNNGIVDTAGFQRTFAPGGSIAIFGRDLAERLEGAQSLPLPTQLGGVSVKIGDRFAPLFFTSAGQINAMIPFEVSGNVNVQVVAGVNSLGNTFPITLARSAPRIYTTNSQGTGQGAILIAGTALVAAAPGTVPGQTSRQAIRGQDFISIYCIGLGAVTNQPPSGFPSVPPSTFFPARTTETPTVTIGGVAVDTSDPNFFSGLAPFFAGLYQINAKVPANAPMGNAVTVVVTTSAGASNPVTIGVV